MNVLCKILIIVIFCSTSSNAGLVGKAWDESVSGLLKKGCTNITAKEEIKMEKSFATIMLGMTSKVIMKEANLSQVQLEDKQEMENLLYRVMGKGCKGALLFDKDMRFKKFNFTEKVRGAMELYIREVLNKKNK